MTEEELAEIEAGVDNATHSAPWGDGYSECSPHYLIYDREKDAWGSTRNGDVIARIGTEADRDFILSAVDDIPALCAEVRRCWARIAELESPARFYTAVNLPVRRHAAVPVEPLIVESQEGG